MFQKVEREKEAMSQQLTGADQRMENLQKALRQRRQ
jgi:hypothetical protein